MNKQRDRQWGAAALAAAILLALIFAPATRPLVRTQLGMSLMGNASLDTEAPRRYLQSHPNDYQLQLVQALDQATAPAQALSMPGPRGLSDSDRRLAALRALESRFPNTPSLYANSLRFALLSGSWAVSEGDWALDGSTKPKNWAKSLNPPSATQLAAFDHDAAQGERLDPNNAYFPLMRAVGLFTAHREAEAMAAVERAAQKPAWREYYGDEVEGRRRVFENQNGGAEALGRAAIAASILFPHYARLRGLARAVTYRAMLTEQAGHPQQGMAIRLALMRCGMIMQTEATTEIGSLVGSAIGAISMARPGGAAPLPHGTSSNDDRPAQQRLDAFCTYAARLRRPDAVREARQMNQIWRQTRAIFQKADKLSMFGLTPLWRLTRWWAADLVVIANVVLMLACGLLAALAARLPRSDGGEASEGAVVLVRVLFGIGVFLALALVWTWQAHALSPLFAQAQSLVGDTNSDPFKVTRVLCLLGSIAAPLLILLGAVAIGPALRSGLFSGIGHCFRVATLPVVCALLILYGALIFGTARQERAVNDSLIRISQHEGRYMASLVGQPWPEARP